MGPRRLLLPLFSAEAFKNYEAILDETVDFMFQRRLSGGKMAMYEEFKRLSLAYNLRMFLDIDERRTPGRQFNRLFSFWALFRALFRLFFGPFSELAVYLFKYVLFKNIFGPYLVLSFSGLFSGYF